MNDEQMQPLLEVWLRDRDAAPRDVNDGIARVVARVPQTRQRGRWWPLPVFGRPVSTFPSRELAPAPIPKTNGPTPARGFTMFSALKFVAAGVIVALFGGFLLAGLLTTQQEGEFLPAAVTESPSPMTTEELLSGMVTEEVEPDVFRVINDGVRDLSYPPGGWVGAGFLVDVTPDGSVWLSASVAGQGLFRLGEEPVFEAFPPFREVAPDGSLWAIGDLRRGIFSFDGEAWTVRATTTDSFTALAVGPDGTVWVVAHDEDKYCTDIEDEACHGTALLRLEDDGSLTTIEDWADVYDGDASRDQLAVSPDGDVSLLGTRRMLSRFDGDASLVAGHVLLRFDGEGWEAIPGPEGWDTREIGRSLDVGPDGTLWVQAGATGGIARFDDPGWTTFTEADGLMQWEGSGSPFFPLLDVAADGSVWLRGGPPDEGCGGVTHYDGMTWTSYLVGSCIGDFAIAPDGSFWLGAVGSTGPLHTYVITPEAVAATE